MGFNMEAIELPGMDIGELGKTEYDVAKLKTNTIQNWQPNKEYKVGDIVKVFITDKDVSDEPVEVTYVCNTAHTSSEENMPDESDSWSDYWSVVMSGIAVMSKYLDFPDGAISGEDLLSSLTAIYNSSHIKEWQPNTDYEVGDIIGICLIEGLKDEYNNTIFEHPLDYLLVCNTAHTSSDTFDVGYWEALTVGSAFYAYCLIDTEEGMITFEQVKKAVNKINSIETQLNGVEELLGGI